MALPEAIAEDDYMIVSGLVFTSDPGSAQQSPCAKQREEIGFRWSAHDVNRLAATAQVHRVSPADQRHILKAVVLRLPVEEVRTCKRVIAWRGFGLIEANQLAGPLIRQGTQEGCIDDTEDSCVRPNSQRQSKNSDQGKSGSATQAANAIANVLDESVHATLLKQAFRRLAWRMVRNFAWNG